MILDLYQQFRLAEATTKGESAKDELSRLRMQADELCRRADTLTLACQAMWELLRGVGQFTDADLMEKMQEVDLRDGQADGKITSGVVPCPSCGRRSRSTRRQCVYCGAALHAHHAFAQP